MEEDGGWNKQWQAKAVMSHPDSETSRERNNLMIKQVKSLFGEEPRELDRFITASQIVQAEAMKYFVEFWRMNKFDCNGILWWNLRDGWPVISDAVVDYYGNKKLAYQYIKKVQKDVCVVIVDEGLVEDAPGKGHPVIVVNDTREAVPGFLRIKEADTKKLIFSAPFSVEENGKLVAG